MKTTGKRLLRLLSGLGALMILLTGCSSKEPAPTATPTATAIITNTPFATNTPAPTPTPTNTVAPTEAPTPTPDPISKLSSTQRNSINMLNWLAYLSQEINASSNNRLYIEDVYSLIVNETYPNAVDTHTQDRLRGIRQALSRYRMVDVKRERIEYLYEQNKAAAIRSAIPNPLTIMTAVRAPSLAGLATTVVYMAINSINSYQSASSQADLQFLKDGWDLDDEARDVFDTIRSDAFDYMLDIVREYDLPGYMTLNENAVDQFVSWKNNENIVRRIQFLESNVETYKAFGSYWLVLAESYFTNGDYEKCLESVHSYEELSTRIFRHDIEYAKILPLAIAAGQSILQESDYIALADRYADLIIENIGNTDWELRYFAAQTYIDLYKATDKSDYLWKAYKEVTNNVNYLVDKQNELNTSYLSAVKDEPIPAGTKKEQEEQIKSYNRLRKEKRKTELPPVYEPLLMNCDLLFVLADQLGISDTEQTRINGILRTNDRNLFLVDALDAKYRFPSGNTVKPNENEAIIFNGREIIIPAKWIAEDYQITLTIAGDNKVEFTDWVITKVDRKTEGDIATFTATLTSKGASDFKHATGETIMISINPHSSYCADTYSAEYRTIDAKPNWHDHIVFWNNDIGFERIE